MNSDTFLDAILAARGTDRTAAMLAYVDWLRDRERYNYAIIWEWMARRGKFPSLTRGCGWRFEPIYHERFANWVPFWIDDDYPNGKWWKRHFRPGMCKRERLEACVSILELFFFDVFKGLIIDPAQLRQYEADKKAELAAIVRDAGSEGEAKP
jgi:hypothetical protein